MRQPGDDDEESTIATAPVVNDDSDEGDAVVEDDLDDHEDLVPMGTMLAAMDEARAAAKETAVALIESNVKQPPFLNDVETQLLGILLNIGRECLLITEGVGFTAADFYVDKRRIVWEAAVAVDEKGKPIDMLTVCDELARRAQLDLIGGAAMLSMHSANAISSANCATFAQMLLDKSKLRAAQRAMLHGLEMARFGDPVDDVIDGTVTALSSIVTRGSGRDFAHLPTVVSSAMKKLPVFGGRMLGRSTGFTDVDDLFLLAPGELVIVAARPSMGKTALALDVTRNIALHRKEPGSVAFFSLEMSAEQLTQRLVAGHSRVHSATRRHHMAADEMSKLQNSAGLVAEAPIFIDDNPVSSIGEIRAKARAKARACKRDNKPPLAAVVIDYIQLVGGMGEGDNRANEVGQVSRGLKSLARELECTVVGLSQLNRKVEERPDKRPLMSDLRESGAIEQDADVIAFLYREEYYAKDRTPDSKLGVAEVGVAKNRNGPTGTAELRFNADVPCFDNLSRV